MDLFHPSVRCPIHGGQIVGLCENIYCSQKERKGCLECFTLAHSIFDPQSNLQDFKNYQGLMKILNESKEKFADKLNVIWTQVQIQQYILLQQFRDHIQRWQFLQQNLIKIFQKHDNFFSQQWKKLTVEDYLIDENCNQGIYNYLEKFDNEISNIEELKNQYLKTSISQEKLNFQDQRNIMNGPILKILKDTLQILSSSIQNTFTIITKQNHFQKISKNDNPHISMCEIILQQGYELKTNNMHKQYQEIYDESLKNELKDYQIQYLKAYSLYYSDQRLKTIDQQLNLLNQSILANNMYDKSKGLKKIILQYCKDNEKRINAESQDERSQPQNICTKQQNNENSLQKPYNSKVSLFFQDGSQNIENEYKIQFVNILNNSEMKERINHQDNKQNQIDVCLLINNTVQMKQQLDFILSSVKQIDRNAKQNIQWAVIPNDKEQNNIYKNVECIIESLSQSPFYEDINNFPNIEQGLFKALKINWQSKLKVIMILTDSPNNMRQQFKSNGDQFDSSNNIENCLKQISDYFQDYKDNQIYNYFEQYFKQNPPYIIYAHSIQDNQQEFINYSITTLEDISKESFIINIK